MGWEREQNREILLLSGTLNLKQETGGRAHGDMPGFSSACPTILLLLAKPTGHQLATEPKKQTQVCWTHYRQNSKGKAGNGTKKNHTLQRETLPS